MDTKRFMIVVKGEIKTNQIISCSSNSATRKYDITFDNGSTYSYAIQNVLFMKNPKILKPEDYIIETPDRKNYI